MKKRYTLEQKKWDSPAEHPDPRAQPASPPASPSATVRIAPATVLAPMAGVTDTVFRRFIKNASQFTTEAVDTNVDAPTTNQQSGCGLIMTEFTSADGLSRMREVQAQALPHLLRRRASHLRAALRLQPRDPRRLRPHCPGRRFRPRQPQPRLPRQARRLLQRRLRPAARSAADREDLPRHPRRRHHPLHRQVPHGLER